MSVFSHVQERDFYIRMVLAVRKTFPNLIKIGELLEEGNQIGDIIKTPTSSGAFGVPEEEKRRCNCSLH